jgi:hypothetical protein
MRAQAPSQARTSGLRLLDKQPPHRLHVRSSDRSATDYPRFDCFRPSADQLREAT